MVVFINKNIISEYISSFIHDSSKYYDKGYVVKKIINKSHPCYNQCGLFTTKKWKPFEILNEYTGEIVNIYNLQTTHSTDYFAGFNVDGLKGIGVDAKNYGNEMRYINHYKNISKEPNVKFEYNINANFARVFVVCIKDINEDIEIVVDYGYEP